MSEVVRANKPDVLEGIPTGASSVVEASAGTGKTYTLEHLIVELVLEEGLSIQNILVVTFTERATAELVERVRGILERLVDQRDSDAAEGEPHWKIDAAKRKRLREALFSFDRAPIYTIHGFCHRILVEHAFSNRRPFDQELVESDELFEEAFHAALRSVFADGGARSVLLEAYVRANSVDDLKSKLDAALATSDRIEPVADFGEFADRLEEFEQRVDGLGSLLEEMRSVFDAIDRDGALNGNKRGKAYRQIRGLERALEAYRADGLGAFLSTAMAVCDADNPFEYLADDSIVNKSARDRYREAWATELEALGEVYFEPLPYIFDEFVPLVERRLAELKARRGEFTYDDMLAYVWEAVREDDELVDTLRGEYDFALVDEFQDTDPIQWKIFERLFFESGSTNPCTLIGDPKQAIYGFRGADVQTYFDAAERVAGTDDGYDPVRLPDNYRSTPALIDAYNEILDQEAAAPFFRGRNDYSDEVGAGFDQKRLVDGRDEEVAPVVVTEVTAPDPDDFDSDGYAGAVFGAWSEEIASLLDPDGPEERLRIWDEDDEAFRELVASDIFVLTRTSSGGDQFADYLRAEGVPHAFYKREGLFETPEARDWYELLQAVERPGERSRRLKAWATPFFALELDEAAAADEVVDENHELAGRLNRWHRHARAGRIGQLVHAVLDESGLLRREVFERHGERELTNYEHLGETFVDWAQSDDLALGDIVLRLGRYVDGEAEPEGREGDLQRLETEQEAVQIMTMHKAKGLSAPVVFVYGGYGLSNRAPYRYYDEEGNPVQYFGNKGDSGSRRRHIEAYRQEEDERLLYVAMTRPEGRLYLPWANPEIRDGSLERSNSPMGPLTERLDAVLEGEPSEGFEVERRHVDSGPPEPSREDTEARDWESVEPGEVTAPEVPESGLPSDAKFGELRAQRRLFVESYSSVDRWTGGDDEPVSNEAFELDERAEPGDEAEVDADEIDGPPPGRRTGLCVHVLLEELDYETVDDAAEFEEWRRRPEVGELVEEVLVRFGLLEHREGLEELVWRALRTPVTTSELALPAMASTDRQTAEMEFWYPIPGETGPTLPELVESGRPGGGATNEGYLRGFVDLVFEWEGRIYAADWKTNWLRGDGGYAPSAIEEVVEQRYDIQATFYATAAARLVARAVDDVEEFERRYGGLAYLFVRGMRATDGEPTPGIYFERRDFEALCELEQRAGELVEAKLASHRDQIAAGAHDRWRTR